MLWELISAFDRMHMRLKGGCYLNTLDIYGTYRCFHRSPKLHLRCYRLWTWDRYCAKHISEELDKEYEE